MVPFRLFKMGRMLSKTQAFFVPVLSDMKNVLITSILHSTTHNVDSTTVFVVSLKYSLSILIISLDFILAAQKH